MAVANKMSYEEGTNFNETNVVQYLAELEEYISSLITYAAFRKTEGYAAIASIPLDKLNKKDFEKAKFAIDAPLYTTIEGAPDGGTVEEEAIVNPAELYKRFNNLINQNKINFVAKNATKQPANPNLGRRDDN